jgi:hypothetical protein
MVEAAFNIRQALVKYAGTRFICPALVKHESDGRVAIKV